MIENNKELALQTRIPKALYTEYKIRSVTSSDGTMRGFLSEIILNFLKEEPWKNGYHIRQPDLRRNKGLEVKPIMFWPEKNVAESTRNFADDMQVSTSSVLYTAFLWWAQKNHIEY